MKAMHEKRTPFSFLVGDMPTYSTIVQLKAENYIHGVRCIMLLRVAFVQSQLRKLLASRELPEDIEQNLRNSH